MGNILCVCVCLFVGVLHSEWLLLVENGNFYKKKK